VGVVRGEWLLAGALAAQHRPTGNGRAPHLTHHPPETTTLGAGSGSQDVHCAGPSCCTGLRAALVLQWSGSRVGRVHVGRAHHATSAAHMVSPRGDGTHAQGRGAALGTNRWTAME